MKPSLTYWQNPRVLWGLYTVLALFAAAQRLLAKWSAEGFSTYENYRIFKYAYPYLLSGQNPYAGHPETWDLYKYSPAFALFMGPFYYLPDAAGLPVWNLLNAWVLLSAVLHLPLISPKQRALMAWAVLPEMLISIQNSQSNALAAGLFLWTFIALEKGRQASPAVFTALNGFIKVFGILSALPMLMYATRWRNWGLLAVFCAVLAALPLLVLSPAQVKQVYVWWGYLLENDHSASLGLSVQGWLQSWFAWLPSKSGIVLSGLGILSASILAALQKNGLPSPRQRLWVWASLLIWVVIFNHKAESPTFVIAMCGAMLWYFAAMENAVSQIEKTTYKILIVTALVMASLSPSDVFSRAWREEIVQPYVLKALPFIVIWAVASVQLFWSARKPSK